MFERHHHRRIARVLLALNGDLLRKVLLKAQGAYGEAISRDLERAIECLQNRPNWSERCMQVMAMTLPTALLWNKIRALRRVLV